MSRNQLQTYSRFTNLHGRICTRILWGIWCRYIYEPSGLGNPIYLKSKEIGKATNNTAELEAIHHALSWCIENVNSISSKKYIRIYTDSQYAQKVHTDQYHSKHHFFLAESIKSLGAKLKLDHMHGVTVHWIPSHIENSTLGW